jgi:hypothetical protein
LWLRVVGVVVALLHLLRVVVALEVLERVLVYQCHLVLITQLR